MVTPEDSTKDVDPVPVCMIVITDPTGKATEAFVGTVTVFAEEESIVIAFPES
jgi:hypothetical protein